MLLRVCVMLSAYQLSFGRDEQWEQWKSTYRKQYKDDAEEEDHRIVWRQNRYMIEAHNREAERGRHSYTLELNHRGDKGSLDMEILKEMLGQRAENSGSDEILEEILGVIAESDLLTRKNVVEEMMEVTQLDDLSKTEILDTMTDRMVLVDQVVTQHILEKVEETFSDYDQKVKERILKNIEQTLSEYNRMSRKLVQDKMAVTMGSGRTKSQSDILRDVTEAIDESKSVAKKLILEQIAEMLANYDKMDPQEKLSPLPKSLDLREKGLVTRVRDQGNCGSCWAFSAAGALEGQLAKKMDQPIELSPQNLVDCNLENTGCDGGHMSLAFKYVMDNGGLNAKEDYPYAGKQQECRYQPSAAAAQCKGFKMIPKGDERALARALFEVGPLSVAINSEDRKFQFYKSGVYYNPDCVTHSRAHAMLLVGYGATANGQKYWLVKNSWGERWGEKGYIRIARNRGNHCGIASEASYPLMGARRKEVG